MTHIKKYQQPVTDIFSLEHCHILQSSVITKKSEEEATEEARGGTSNIWDETDSQNHSSLFDTNDD